MGNLAHLVEGQANLKARLEAGEQLAQTRKMDVEGMSSHVDTIIEKRIAASTQHMLNAMRSLVADTSKDSLFAASVQQTVLAISQNNQLLMRDISSDMQKLIKDMAASQTALRKEVKEETTSMADGLSNQITALGLQVDQLPTEFPKQIETDLSGIDSSIKSLEGAVKGIKMPEMPKTADVTPQLKAMEKRMGNRMVEFEIERDQFGVMQKIVAKEGKV